jgi:hypothetical protein
MPRKASAPQIAALVLLVASSLATAARADDEYGTGHETLIREVAVTSHAALTVIASAVPIAGTRPDAAGAGGPQDELARLIYHPGSGTDW